MTMGERGKKAAGQEFGKGKVDREGKLGGEENIFDSPL